MNLPRVRHLREACRNLEDQGYAILEVWHGRHWRIRISRGGVEKTVTCATSPQDSKNAVLHTLRQASKGVKM